MFNYLLEKIEKMIEEKERKEKLKKVWEEIYNKFWSYKDISIDKKLGEHSSLYCIDSDIKKCKYILELYKNKNLSFVENLQGYDSYFFLAHIVHLKSKGVIETNKNISVIEEYLKELEKLKEPLEIIARKEKENYIKENYIKEKNGFIMIGTKCFIKKDDIKSVSRNSYKYYFATMKNQPNVELGYLNDYDYNKLVEIITK